MGTGSPRSWRGYSVTFLTPVVIALLARPAKTLLRLNAHVMLHLVRGILDTLFEISFLIIRSAIEHIFNPYLRRNCQSFLTSCLFTTRLLPSVIRFRSETFGLHVLLWRFSRVVRNIFADWRSADLFLLFVSHYSWLCRFWKAWCKLLFRWRLRGIMIRLRMLYNACMLLNKVCI